MINKHKNIDEEILSSLLYSIASELSVHIPASSFYKHLLLVARNSILNLYGKDKENCNQIFEHFQNLGINLFSQKKSWGKVNKIEDMPNSYKEVSLFISKKEKMPW